MLRRFRVDLAVYGFFAAFALVTALTAVYSPHRLWGWYGVAAYSLGAVVLLATRRRWAGIWASVGVGIVAPLAHLVTARWLSGGDWAPDPARWNAQPEVWIIERSARLLLTTGSPYVDVGARAPTVWDYTPYGPAMAVFGLPRTLTAAPLFDVRIVFALVTALCVVAVVRLCRPAPVWSAYVGLLCPATALHLAVAGDDAVVLALTVLALALAAARRPAAAGIALACAVCCKLIVAPALLVVGVWVRGRDRVRLVAAFLVTTAVVAVPVIAGSPSSFVDDVIRFPLGAGSAPSPAASPLPGHLLASTGPFGHWADVGLLATAAAVMAAWVVLRPPADGADAALRLAVGITAAMMLSPASRWGYVIYPLVLLAARPVLARR